MIECYLRTCPHHYLKEPFCVFDECAATPEELADAMEHRRIELTGAEVSFDSWLEDAGYAVLADDETWQILHELREGNPFRARQMLENHLMNVWRNDHATP